MKKLSIYTLLLAMALISIQACGPSEEEQRAAEQARLDSLRQVEQQRIDQLMKAREDSIARAQEQQQVEEESNPRFDENGEYAVQVGAFRSKEKAESYKKKLDNKDYPNVYVVKIGEEETGDIWFRLRVGFFNSEEAAADLGAELAEDLNSGYWVSKVKRAGG